MAGPQWRQVNGPQFGDSIQAYRLGADLIDRGLLAAKSGLQGWQDNRVRETSNSFMADMMKYQGDPEAFNRAAADGTLMRGYDPRNLTAESIAAIGARSQDLQNFQLGSSNIRRVDLGNEGLVESNRNQKEVNSNYTTDRGLDFSDRMAGRAVRPLMSQLDAMILNKGRGEAAKWFATPEIQAQVANLSPTDRAAFADRIQGLAGNEINMTYNEARTETERVMPEVQRSVIRGNDATTGATLEGTRQSQTVFDEETAAVGAVNGILAQTFARPADRRAALEAHMKKLGPRAYGIAREYLMREDPTLYGQLRLSDGSTPNTPRGGGPGEPAEAVQDPPSEIQSRIPEGYTPGAWKSAPNANALKGMYNRGTRQIDNGDGTFSEINANGQVRTYTPPARRPTAQAAPAAPAGNGVSGAPGQSVTSQITNISAPLGDIDWEGVYQRQNNAAPLLAAAARSGPIAGGTRLVQADSSFGFDNIAQDGSVIPGRDPGNSPAAQLIRAAAPGMETKGPQNVLNYEARAKTGITHVPGNVDTLGKASTFAKQLNRAGADSSAMGTFQIVGQTLRGYAPKVFGKNWENVPFTPEAQDQIARAIFNDHRGSAQALRKQWVSLSLSEAEAVRKMPWSQARLYIAAGESGNGRVGGAVPGESSVPAMLAQAQAVRAPSTIFGSDLARPAPVAGPQGQNAIVSPARTAEERMIEVNKPSPMLSQTIAQSMGVMPPVSMMSMTGRPSTNVAALLAQAGARRRVMA
jgi:hypothetical protein